MQSQENFRFSKFLLGEGQLSCHLPCHYGRLLHSGRGGWTTDRSAVVIIIEGSRLYN